MKVKNKVIKLAYLDQSHVFSGAEVSLYHLIENLDSARFTASIWFLYPMPHQHRYDGLKVSKYFLASSPQWWMGSDFWKRPLRGTDSIKRAILGFRIAFRSRKLGVDILHINLVKNDIFWWVFWANIFRIKVVLHCRSDLIEWVPNKLIQSLSDRIISVSDFIKDKVLSKRSSAKVTTVYDPVLFGSTGFDQELKESFQRSLGFEFSDKLLSSIGLLSDHKGHDTAIKAFHRLLRYNPDMLLYIVGGGSDDELNVLKNLVKSLDIEEKVIFSGKQIANMEPIYRSSDLVFSLTKRGEAFGRVPFESMSYGTPVIAPNQGGAAELIINNKNGFLVNTLDLDAITKTTDEIMSNPVWALAITEKGRVEFKELLSPANSAKGVEKVYFDCICS